MLSALAWVPKGAVVGNPTRHAPTAAELDSALEEAKHATLTEQEARKQAAAHAREAAQALSGGGAAASASASASAARRQQRQAERGHGEGEEDIEALYGLQDYDDEPGADLETAVFGRLPAPGGDDGEWEDAGDDDDDDESDIEDFSVRRQDTLLLAARADPEQSVLEVNVFDSEAASVFVHHDIVLNEFPLCVQWLQVNGSNLAALGSFKSTIDLWSLDVLDAPTPTVTLSGGHSGPVMGVAWAPTAPSALVSSSADAHVCLWDVTQARMAAKLRVHRDKVQAVAIKPDENSVVCSGGFDKRVCVADFRSPTASASWSVKADVTSVAWNPYNTFQVVSSQEDGSVVCFDARTGQQQFTLVAHTRDCTSMSFLQSGLLATVSTDRSAAVWNVSHAPAAVDCVVRRANFHIGKLLCCAPHPSEPATLAIGGDKGKFAVWDASESAAVASLVGSGTLSAVAATAAGSGGTTAATAAAAASDPSSHPSGMDVERDDDAGGAAAAAAGASGSHHKNKQHKHKQKKKLARRHGH